MMLRVLLGVLVLLLVALLVAERYVLTRAPREASARLSAAIGVPTHVAAVGRPRDWLRTRTIAAVSLTARDIPIREGKAKIDHLEVTLLGVRLEGRGEARRVVAEGGTFVATLSESQVRLLVDLPPLVKRLELRGDRLRFVSTGGLAIEVRLRADRGGIELRPTGNPLDVFLPVRYRIALDALPAGAVIERAVVRDGSVVASGPIDGARLAGPLRP